MHACLRAPPPPLDTTAESYNILLCNHYNSYLSVTRHLITALNFILPLDLHVEYCTISREFIFIMLTDLFGNCRGLNDSFANQIGTDLGRCRLLYPIAVLDVTLNVLLRSFNDSPTSLSLGPVRVRLLHRH